MTLLLLLSLLLVLTADGNFEIGETGATKIFTSQGTHKDYFGHTVGVYGDTIVVGAYASNTVIPESGSAFSFKRNVTGNVTTWVEEDFIAARQIYPHDYFGGSVSLWDRTVIIGAYLDQAMGSKSGSAFIFRYSHGTWNEVQKLSSLAEASADFFGQDVGLFGDRAVVGAYGHSDPASYYNGAAYVFQKLPNSHKWTQQSFLKSSDSQDYQMFGYSVAIHNDTIVIGAYGDSNIGSYSGAVYIFKQVPSAVKLPEDDKDNTTDVRLHAYEWVEAQKLLPGDPKSHANFGISLDLSSSGSSSQSYDIVIGSSLATGAASVTGAVYVFSNNAKSRGAAPFSLWSQRAKLYADDGVGDERFGSSVAIDGRFVAVGAPEDRTYGTDSGSAYLFEKDILRGWVFQRKLGGNDSQPYDNFGSSCSLYENTVVIGAEKAFGIEDSSGAVYIFSTDANVRKPAPKKYSIEEKEQFVLFLAILPILLIVVPLFVISGTMYLISFHKTNHSWGSVVFPRGSSDNFTSTPSPLDEFTSLHGSSSDSGEMDTSLDLSTVSCSSSTPLALSTSRHGLVSSVSATLHPSGRNVSQKKIEEIELVKEKSSDLPGGSVQIEATHVNVLVGEEINKNHNTIQDAMVEATEDTSPMLYYHMLHSEKKNGNSTV